MRVNSRSGSVRLRPLACLLLIGMVLGVVASAGASAASAPLSISVRGNALVDGAGNRVLLHGVNYSGTEYACVQGYGIFDGPNDLASIQAMQKWHANAVRIPLNEDCWLGINGVAAAYSSATYQKAISDYVNLLVGQGLYPILELHWSAPGTQKASGQQPMPDADHTPAFWTSVATTFKSNPAVLLDLFNEPYPASNTDTTSAWTCWKNGGTCSGISYQVAGMQTLVDSVRNTGATNVIMAGGVNYANSLSQWLQYKPTDSAGQLAASAHVYGNNACGAQNNGACLTTNVAPVAAQVPVIFGETGETYDDSECTSANTKVILPWADANNVSYLAWTWDTWGSCLSLINDYSGTVNTSTPAGAAYATYVHDHLAAVATSTPTPTSTSTPTPTPTSTSTPTPTPTSTSTPTPTPTSTSTPTPTPTSTSTPTPTPTSTPTPTTGGVAMPVISRGVPAYTNDNCGGSYPAGRANDASYDTLWRTCNSAVSTTNPKNLTYDLSRVAPASRRAVVVSWFNDPMTSPYDHTAVGQVGYNIPSGYKLQANAAAGGKQPSNKWVTLLTVSGNTQHSRQHLIDLTGYNWFRFSATASDGSSGNADVALNLDVQDASKGSGDSWMFYGDAITQDAMSHDSRKAASGATTGNFAQLVSASSASFPAFQNGGIAGWQSADGASKIGSMLKAYPGRYVSLAFGSNDALNGVSPTTYRANMQSMISTVVAAGKVPVLPTIPWGRATALQANVPGLNNQIASLLSANPNAVAGPDLYSYFAANQSLIGPDGVSPSWDNGSAAYRRVWADWAAARFTK